MVPVEVEGVRLERAEPTVPTELVLLTPQDRTYVMLRSPERSRVLDIQIGSAEAFAISSALKGNRWGRPMTHDLLGEVVAALGPHSDKWSSSNTARTTYTSPRSKSRAKTETRSASRLAPPMPWLWPCDWTSPSW